MDRGDSQVARAAQTAAGRRRVVGGHKAAESQVEVTASVGFVNDVHHGTLHNPDPIDICTAVDWVEAFCNFRCRQRPFSETRPRHRGGREERLARVFLSDPIRTSSVSSSILRQC